MGHYRSEMGYEEEDRREAAAASRSLARMAKNIDKDVKRRGVGAVLADILCEPLHYKLGVDT